jgi:molecular chaperone DnaK
MKKDADAHAAEDKKRREEVDLKNQADTLVFQTEKQLKEFGDKVGPEVKAKIESAKDRLKEAIGANNNAAIKPAMDALNEAWNEASQQMYQSATAGAQGRPGAAPGPEQGPTGDSGQKEEKKVEDAQYEVVDDKDKKS